MAGVAAPRLVQVGITSRLAAVLGAPALELTAATTLLMVGVLGPAPVAVDPPPQRVETADVVDDVPSAPWAPTIVLEALLDGAPAGGGARPAARPVESNAPTPDIESPRAAAGGGFEAAPAAPAPRLGPTNAPLGDTDVPTMTVAPGDAMTIAPGDAVVIGPPTPVGAELAPPSIDVPVPTPPVATPPVAIDVGSNGAHIDVHVPGTDGLLPVNVPVPVTLPQLDVAVAVPAVPPVADVVGPVDAGIGASVSTGDDSIAAHVEAAGQQIDVAIDVSGGAHVAVDVGAVCIDSPSVLDLTC